MQSGITSLCVSNETFGVHVKLFANKMTKFACNLNTAALLNLNTVHFC